MKAILKLAALLLVVLALTFQRPSAQGADRLQQHGEITLNAQQDGWYAVKLQAVCDTGNGTMIYLARGAKEDTVRMELLPNGCAKAKAER